MTIVSAEPVTLDLKMYRGDHFALQLTFKNTAGDPINVSASTFAAQVRKYESDVAPTATFAIDTTNAATGVVVLSLASSVTNGLPQEPEVLVWDLQETAAGKVRTLFKGSVTVSGDVTRA